MSRHEREDRVRDAGAQDERGQALVLVVIVMVVALMASMTLVLMTNRNTSQVSSSRENGQLLAAARAGYAMGKEAIWDDFVNGRTSQLPRSEYFTFLDTTIALQPNVTHWLDSAGVWQEAPTNALNLGSSLDIKTTGAISVSVTAVRADDVALNQAYIHLTSTATNTQSGETRVSEIVLKSGGADFPGLEYGFLTNNVNCTFCHAVFDNVTRAYPGMIDPTTGSPFATHERIKIASLEALQVRSDKGSGTNLGRVAGTLYAVGAFQDKHGEPITNYAVLDGNFQFVPIDQNPASPTYGKLTVNSGWGNAPNNNGVDTSGTLASISDGYPTQQEFANFYKGYNSTDTFDGEMPEYFPPTVSPGDDKVLDDSEWQNHLTTKNMNGTISGGFIKEYDDTSNSLNADLVTAGVGKWTLPRGGAGNVGAAGDGSGLGVAGGGDGDGSGLPSNQSSSKKHVVLIGTKENPIKIDGRVAINGDVILSGYVEGTGQLLARGNIYLPNDVVYNDANVGNQATRTFGQNGTQENTWAIAAAGNIMHGSYNSTRQWAQIDGVVTGTAEGWNQLNGNLLEREMGLFNRMEWAKTQQFVAETSNSAKPSLTNDPTDAVTYASAAEVLDNDPRLTANGGTGGFDTKADLVGEPIINTVYQGPIPSTARSGDDDYIPRFYSLGESNDVLMANNEISAWWDNTSNNGKGQWKGAESIINMNKLTITGSGKFEDVGSSKIGFVRSNYAATSDWIGQTKMYEMFKGEEDKRLADNGGTKQGYELDALLYTNNTIWVMARASTVSSSGQLTVNGSIVAADTGVLVGGGLTLNYDQRTSKYLKLVDDGFVQLNTVARRER